MLALPMLGPNRDESVQTELRSASDYRSGSITRCANLAQDRADGGFRDAQPAIVEYYITARDTTLAGPLQLGQTIDYPVLHRVAWDPTQAQMDDLTEFEAHAADATPKYRRFFVGERETLRFEDFEADPVVGWTSDGNPSDWQFADPTGFLSQNVWADPLNAFSGLKCAGTDLTGVGLNPGSYELNADTWLLSPSFVVAPDAKTYLSFQRWLSIQSWSDFLGNQDYSDFAEIWVVRDADTSAEEERLVWRNHKNITLVDNKANTGSASWLPFELDISAAIASAYTAQIKWVLRADDGPLTIYGGWAIDDVYVFAIEAP